MSVFPPSRSRLPWKEHSPTDDILRGLFSRVAIETEKRKQTGPILSRSWTWNVGLWYWKIWCLYWGGLPAKSFFSNRPNCSYFAQIRPTLSVCAVGYTVTRNSLLKTEVRNKVWKSWRVITCAAMSDEKNPPISCVTKPQEIICCKNKK